MMEGAAVAMISALAKTTSAIEANVGRRRVTRLEGWMHSAWKIMRSYARARASWIMQGGYTTEPRADRGLKCQPRAGLPSFVRNKERNTRRKLPPSSIKFSWNKFWNPFAFPFFSKRDDEEDRSRIFSQNLDPRLPRGFVETIVGPTVIAISTPRFHNLRLCNWGKVHPRFLAIELVS